MPTTFTIRRRALLAAGLALAAITSGAACSSSSSPGHLEEPDWIADYLKTLPAWADFAPTQPDLEPYVIGSATDPVTVVSTITYDCQTWPCAVQRTPGDLVMYAPRPEILWPGALLQGKSYRDGKDLDALLGLPIDERAPMRISIPALKTADNFRQVTPNQSSVSNAIGAMLGAATVADFGPASVSHDIQPFHSEQQLALALGLSGRYLGFAAKAGFSPDQALLERTVVFHHAEKLFDVVAASPQAPRDVFGPGFTKARLDEEVARGRIGPDNPPVYVSTVAYGRMFTFALTSGKTEPEIRGALEAAYAYGSGKGAALTPEQQAILSASRVWVAWAGGDVPVTPTLVKSGDWRPYFGAALTLAKTVPLSFTLRSLVGDGVARVTEFPRFDRTVCEPHLNTGFLDVQTVQVFPTARPVTVASGDLDGDGRMDLVWDSLGVTTNQVRVAFGKADGTFDAATGTVVTIPGTPGGADGWTKYTLMVTDTNGDGRDDLVWTGIGAGTSTTYVARSLGNGTFAAPTVHTRSDLALTTDPPATTVRAIRVAPPANGVLWNRFTTLDNDVLATKWLAGAPTDLAPQRLARPSGGWAPFQGFGTMVGNVAGHVEKADDLVWGAQGGLLLAALNDGAGAFTVKPVVSSAMACPGGSYQCPYEKAFRIGDVNGDGKADVVRLDATYASAHYCPCTYFLGCWCDWVTNWNGATQVLVSNGQGSFAPTGTQGGWQASLPDPFLQDVSGDGKADLVWAGLPGAAWVRVARATANASGGFTGFTVVDTDRAPKTALPPGQTNWSGFRVLFGDVNGDGTTDIVLTNASAAAAIYVYVRPPPPVP